MKINETIKNAVGKAAGLFNSALPLPVRIKQYYAQHGMAWCEANIIGVRLAKDFYTNRYLDLLCLVTDAECIVLKATTVPGPYWTAENQKKFGVYPAVLCLGYYPKSHGFTNHKGHPKQMALGQRVKLPCFKDHSRDSVMQPIEGPYFEHASAGMNIHTQFEGDTDDKVNFASAGCQVAQNRAAFLGEFMKLLRETREAKKGAAARFDYFLTDESFEFASELKRLAQ